MATGLLSVNVDSRQVDRLLERAPAATHARLGQLIEAGAIYAQRGVRVAAAVAVTGQLRNSVIYTMDADRLVAEVKPTAPYAEAVENGSKPHYVSVAEGTPLRAWAEQKGVNPFAVQASIRLNGTKPHPFVQPTFEVMKPTIEADIARGVSEFVTELNYGL